MPWEMLYGVGALVLLGALIYGMVRYRTRNRKNDPITEAATRAEYDDPAKYPARRDDFEDRLRPS